VVQDRLKIPGIWLAIVIAFLFGLSLLAISFWIRPYITGQQALLEGEYQNSLDAFARAEQRFNNFGITRQIFPEAYQTSVANQFYILYQTGEYDALLEKTASSPLLAPVHYWTGCALFRRAGSVTDAQERLAWLERAADEFRSALELEPDNWDAKYNYELSMRLIAELKDEDKPPPQILEILRPRPRQGDQPFRQTG
jgi:tetratricopeptide (TPR) repeat protein